MFRFNVNSPDSPPKFSLGTIVLTAEAIRRLSLGDVSDALTRHAQCDWGDACREDKDANDSALRDGLRLLSVYHDRNRLKFWIITEADRSATTVLFPDEY